MKRSRLIMTLFLILATLSIVTAATLVYGASLDSGAAGVSFINGHLDLDEVAYEAITMGKPKPGTWG